jgi:hypothetical protein
MTMVLCFAASLGCGTEIHNLRSKGGQETDSGFSLNQSAGPRLDEIKAYAAGIKSGMDSLGYESADGLATYNSDGCGEPIAVFGNCFGNNPVAKYLTFKTAAFPAEYVDPFYGDVASQVVDGKTFRPTRRMRSDEGLVVVLRMPPRAAYFGYQTYLFSRYGAPVPPRFSGLPVPTSPNPERTQIFNSLSNPINSAVIGQGLPGGEPWNQLAVFVTTADQRFVDAARKALVGAGIPASRIFIEPIGKRAKLGLDATADDLGALVRYPLPENEVEADLWKAELPVAVLRIKRKDGEAGTVRLEDAVLTKREGVQEADLASSRDALTKELRRRLKAPLRARTESFAPLVNFGIDTYKCIDSLQNCLGDSRDTDTYRKGPDVILGSSDVLVIVGVNHTRTGNASYVSLAMSDAGEIRGVDSVSQVGASAGFANTPQVFNGSAQRVLKALGNGSVPATLTNLDKLYVRIVARDCTGLPECTTLSADRDLGVALDRNLSVVQRAYLQPGKLTSADPGIMVGPVQFQVSR